MINVEGMTPNRSKTYLLPLLSEFCYFPDNIVHNLKNTYIFDKDKEHFECIYLLFNYDIKNPNFTKFENQLTKVEGFEKHYDLHNNLVLYVIAFPQAYIKEYYAFIKGKYSSYGKTAQNLVLDYLTARRVNPNFVERIGKIFNRDAELKEEIEAKLRVKLSSDSELAEIMSEEDETINIKENIINHYEPKI